MAVNPPISRINLLKFIPSAVTISLIGAKPPQIGIPTAPKETGGYY